MKLRIVTPLRPIVDAEVSELVGPGSEGEFGVLSQHVTFLGGLKPGVIVYTEGGARKKIVVSGGYAEVRQDVITVLADDAQFPEEIDGAQARSAILSIKEELARGTESGSVTEKLLRDLALAEARASVALQ